MNSVRDLLDLASTGGPTSPTSVDHLVRLGRRRQRVVVAGVAGGTAAVVAAGAAVAAVATRPAADRQASGTSTTVVATTTAKAATTSTSTAPAPSTVASHPSATATSTTSPSSAPPSGSLRPSASPPASVHPSTPTLAVPAGYTLLGQVPAYTAQVLDGGRRVWAQMWTKQSCDAHALLAATETASEVRLFLYVTTPDKPDPKAKIDCRTDWAIRPPKAPITSNFDAGGSTVELASPLGNRHIVDGLSGAQLPYLDAADVRMPSWLPPGFQQVGDIQPWDGEWTLEFRTAADSSGTHYQDLTLEETPTSSRDLGQPANTTAAGNPAWYSGTTWGRQLNWWSHDMALSMSVSATTVDPCLPSEPQAQQDKGHCAATVDVTLTEADLKRIAESIPSS